MSATAKSSCTIVRLAQPTPFARALRAVRALVAGAAYRARAARKHRQDMIPLASADDRMLADIGLTRGDVRDAFAGSLWEDPTILLRSRALERRLGRRGVTHGFPSVAAPAIAPTDDSRRPPTDRPARFAV
jgi:uncharacterized protein YjiS (DUF1127 family)